MRALSTRRLALVRRLAAFALLLGGWEGAARLRLVDPFFVPPPSRVAQVLWTLFAGGSIWQHLEATFSAALIGLALGLMAGALLGFIAAITPLVAELLEPLMILLNAIPRVILAPLFIIWFGIGLGSKIAIAFVLVAVITFFAVYSGIREVDKRLIERVVTLGGGSWTLTREVYLPSVTSWVLSNLKVAVGFAFTGAVVGEFVAASRGLGYLLTFAQSTFNTAQVLAIIVVIMGFVLLLFSLAGLVERRLLRWRNP